VATKIQNQLAKRGGEKYKFFHRSTIRRRMHSNIAFINNRQGERLKAHEAVEQEFKEYFQGILQEPPGCRDQAI